MSALLIQKIGLLSTQGLNITSAHTAIAQNPAGAGEVLLSVEPPRYLLSLSPKQGADRLKEESRVVASAPRSEYVKIYSNSFYGGAKAQLRTVLFSIHH